MTKKVTDADLSKVAGLSNRKAAEMLGTSKDAVHLARTRARHSHSVSEVNETRKPRILAIDLETRPNLAYVWGLWNQNVGLNQIVEQTEVICFGARWLDEKHVEIRSVHRDGKQAMLDRIWTLMDEADVVMGWNSTSFDVKHLNREFLMAGMTPPSPYTQIDLMRVSKANFRFPSNKLDWMAKSLGIGAKVQHEGFSLWTKCMAGDDKAWDDMYTYQAQDVHLLIDIYEELKPWIRTHPNMSLFLDGAVICAQCGSHKLQERGFLHKGTSKYKQYLCHQCGSWSYDPKSVTRAATRRS